MVAVGGGHACALLSTNELKCWGRNGDGQLGLGDTFTRGESPDEMGDALPAVDLGDGRVVKRISLGYFHSCVLFSDGDVKCWGNNSSGQLGLGDKLPRGNLPGQMGEALSSVNLGMGRKATAITAQWQSRLVRYFAPLRFKSPDGRKFLPQSRRDREDRMREQDAERTPPSRRRRALPSFYHGGAEVLSGGAADSSAVRDAESAGH